MVKLFGLSLYESLVKLLNKESVEEFDDYYQVKINETISPNKLLENFSEGISYIEKNDSVYKIYKKTLNENTKPLKAKKMEEKKDKPRSWSCEYWSKTDISEILNEVINPDSIDVAQLNVKDSLSDEVFDENGKMLPDVRKTLLNNIITFIKSSKLNKLKYNDVIVTGSMANYNWHEDSDIDLHLLLDFTDLSNNNEFISDFFNLKKDKWNKTIEAKIGTHDIEMYIQDTNEPHAATGVYSLIKDDWLLKPTKKMISFDSGNLQLKAADFMNKIDDFIENSDSIDADDITNLLDRIKKYRKIGLNKDGEFSTENLVFKILRNNGYIGKLIDLKNEIITKDLTLENKMAKNYILKEEQIKELVKRKKLKKLNERVIKDDKKIIH